MICASSGHTIWPSPMQIQDKENTQGAEGPCAFLRALLLERRRKNPAYSTRAFARDLGMSQALLSLILNGRRPLTMKQVARISILLNLSQEQSRDLMEWTLLSLP